MNHMARQATRADASQGSVVPVSETSVPGHGVPAAKYQPFAPVALSDREWPSKSIETPPIWCSVDLRDGNQALIEPMDLDRKLRMFKMLVAMGFEEIEVGFPSASQTEFDFTRLLIEQKLIPDDVTIQVLTQAREDLIRRTFDSIRGAPRAIVHIYNSTSPVQRRVVFRQKRKAIVQIAVTGAKLVRDLAEKLVDTDVILEYSPESFSATELEFAKEICEAVMDVWRPTSEERIILNLPATVEMATPNVYADQIEWFSSHVQHRDCVVLSIHPHNDRGTAVAAAELAIMAGADRVEGTLFGNGERTGNVDVVTLALNLWSQGIHPGLDFSDINNLVRVAEHCNRLPVHPRHPYAGDLVFTAFSGSHQDAIRKGFELRRTEGSSIWNVPYLHIDPADLGRTYEAVIRINSQSGKGGIAYVMEEEFGYLLPRLLQIEFRQVVQGIAEATGEEISPDQIFETFETEYLMNGGRFQLVDHRMGSDRTDVDGADSVALNATVAEGGRLVRIYGTGNGPLAAFVDALHRGFGISLRIRDYREHALGAGADAVAVAYVDVETAESESFFGVGRHENLVAASLGAVLSAVNRRARRTSAAPRGGLSRDDPAAKRRAASEDSTPACTELTSQSADPVA